MNQGLGIVKEAAGIASPLPAKHRSTSSSSSRPQLQATVEGRTSAPSCAEWEESWNQLAAEAKELELACVEDQRIIAELDDFKNDIDDSPMGDPIALFPWMDECLYGGLVRLRSEVHAMRLPADAEEMKNKAPEVRQRLDEFVAQQEHLAATLDVAGNELESMLESVVRRAGGWVMETSVLCSPVPARSPPWRGVRGGGPAMPDKSPLGPKWRATEGIHEMDNDPEALKIREDLLTLEEEVRQAGGPTGGWREVDQEIFERVWRVFRRQPSCIVCERVAERLKDISYDEITVHLDWFLKFEQQQVSRRKLLARWRERIAEMEQQATEVQEMNASEEQRRKEGLKRCRSADQRRLVGQWRQTQAGMKEQAATLERSAQRKKAQMERERSRKQQEEIDKQRVHIDKYRHERAAAAEAEIKAEEKPPFSMSPEVKKRIKQKEADMIKKDHEARALLRPRFGQPSPKVAKNPAYQHVESNLFASTAALRHRMAARQKEQQEFPGEPEPEAASAPETAAVYEARMHNEFEAYKASLESSWRRSGGSMSAADMDSELAPPCTFEAVD